MFSIVSHTFGWVQKHEELLEVVTVAELCQEGTLRDHIDILYNVGSCPISGAPSCEGQGLPSPAPSECAFPVMDQVRAISNSNVTDWPRCKNIQSARSLMCQVCAPPL